MHTAAAAIEDAGGAARAIVGDVRIEDDISRAVAETVDRFGGIAPTCRPTSTGTAATCSSMSSSTRELGGARGRPS